MRHSVIWLTALALMGVPAAPALAENLVVNGGFETGDFSGWTANGNFTFVAGNGGPNYGGYGAHSGNYYAALGTVGSHGSLTQVLNTTPGQTYALSFYLASDGGTPNHFGVEWNGQFLKKSHNIPMHGYQLETFTVTATSTTTTLKFFERDDPGYLSLDDIIVKPTTSAAPEPGSVALAGGGVFCIGVFLMGRRWRRPLPANQ